jgi:cation diffusion facilitator CzcD-associated flavoprotein CzcO
MTESVEVVVIGAGQAGLSLSHELSGADVEHVVLERGRVAETWRGRWDGFGYGAGSSIDSTRPSRMSASETRHEPKS